VNATDYGSRVASDAQCCQEGVWLKHCAIQSAPVCGSRIAQNYHNSVNVRALARPLVAGILPGWPVFDRRSRICGWGYGIGQVSSEFLGFPFPYSFHRLPHIHHLSSRAGTIGQLVVEVPSGLSLNLKQKTKKRKTIFCLHTNYTLNLLPPDFVRHLVFEQCFRSWISFHPHVRGPVTSNGSTSVNSSPTSLLRTERDTVSETLCSFRIQTVDNIQEICSSHDHIDV
jgi:hypothetical protein